jgi:uncharacterized membrane protein YoaK (UPF0700 family)
LLTVIDFFCFCAESDCGRMGVEAIEEVAMAMTRQRAAARFLIADEAHGPLPVLLLGLTALSGIVDAVSILALGRVFVANMTGNVVFIGFGLAGAVGFSLAASLLGLAGFLVGAGGGGRLIGRLGSDRARLLAWAASLELVLFAGATVLVGLTSQPVPVTARDVAVFVLAMASGLQNAVARRLAVPDLTTTVLTMTLTGIASDVRAGIRSVALARRLLAVGTMLAGAVIGAELVLHSGPTAALITGSALLAAIATAAWQTTRHPGAWRSGIRPSTAPTTQHGGT